MARVNKIDSPLLVIGLGGTGSDMARSIKDAFRERMNPAAGSDIPPRTRFLIIDTDESEKEKNGWSDDEFAPIEGSFWDIKADGLQPWELSWFDNGFEDPDHLLEEGNGAGVYRQISRLYLFRRLEAVHRRLITAVANVLAVNPGENGTATLEIRVLAGISGGTGSGIFLDMAYLIRHWLENDTIRLAPGRYTLEAMLVLPDVTIQHHAADDDIHKNLYAANGYAALTELDFWMNYEQHRHVYRQRYSPMLEVTWSGKPYNDVCLMTSHTTDGTQFRNAYSHVRQAAAEYMVNCFSAGAGANRSMNGGSGVLPTAFSFASVRSNNLASMRAIRRENFVPYAYRSIGAFSNAGDEEDISNRQWELILDAAVEAIGQNAPDMSGRQMLSIEEECIRQGIGHEDAGRVVQEFVDRHPFRIEDIFGENFGLNMLRSMTYDTAPHGSKFDDFKRQLDVTLGDEKRYVYESGWRILKGYVDEIVRDPEKGPQYAYTVITDALNGLIAQLQAEKRVAAVQESETNSYVLSYSGAEGNCEDQYGEIRGTNPVLHPIRINAMLETYRADTENLYIKARRRAYYRAQSDALDRIIENLNKYAALLGDMTRRIQARKNEYEEMLAARRNRMDNMPTLLNTEKVQSSLVAAFNAEGERQQIIKRAFDTIAGAVDGAMNLDKREFTDNEVARRLSEGIEELRAACFRDIDGMSVQDKIMAYGDVNGQTMRDYTVKVLMPKLTRGAMPMFDTNIALDGNNSVHAYMGVVPIGANEIVAGIAQFMAQNKGTYANLKLSNTVDRVFWVTSVFGMPLKAYGALAGFADTYRQMRDIHRAVHLCMSANAGLNDPSRQDWTKLPSPLCPRTKAESDGEERARALEESGVLTVDVAFTSTGDRYNKVPNIFWRRLRPIQDGVAIITKDQVEEKLEEIGRLPVRSERSAEAQRLLDQAEIIPIDPDALPQKVQAWINVLGLNWLEMDRMAPHMPKSQIEQLKRDWVESYRRAICEYIARSPQLLAEMEVNEECRELLKAKIAEWSRPDSEQLGQDAVTFGRMYRYGLLRQTMMSCKFNNDAMVNNSTIDDAQDQEHDAAMAPNFPCFASYSVLMRNLVYYAAAIARIDNRDRLQRDGLSGIEKAISDAGEAEELPEKLAADIRSYLDNAGRLMKELNATEREVNTLYAAGTMAAAERTMVLGLLEAVKKDTEKFRRLWERHVR